MAQLVAAAYPGGKAAVETPWRRQVATAPGWAVALDAVAGTAQAWLHGDHCEALIDFTRLPNSAVLIRQCQYSSNRSRLSSMNRCTCLSTFAVGPSPATTSRLSITMEAVTLPGLKLSGGSIASLMGGAWRTPIFVEMKMVLSTPVSSVGNEAISPSIPISASSSLMSTRGGEEPFAVSSISIIPASRMSATTSGGNDRSTRSLMACKSADILQRLSF